MKLRNWLDKLFAIAFYPPILMLMVVIYIIASIIWNNTLYAIWGLMFLMFSVFVARRRLARRLSSRLPLM